MLIDMKWDPGEMNNLAELPEYRDELNRHRRLLMSWAKRHNDRMALTYAVPPEAAPAGSRPAARGQSTRSSAARRPSAALGVVRENEVPMADLCAFALPWLAKLQVPRNVRFAPAGYSALAGPVAEASIMPSSAGQSAGATGTAFHRTICNASQQPMTHT